MSSAASGDNANRRSLRGISVDMSADYCRLAEWRVNDPDELAHAARVEKPPKQVDGQALLFGEESA